MKEQPFQRIKDAARTTGLSTYFLRNGVRNNTIPFVRSGRTVFIVVPALLRQLSAEPEQDEHDASSV